MTLNDQRDKCHEIAKSKGWYDDGPRNTGEQLMLIVTEVAEAMEEVRKHGDRKLLYFSGKDSKPEGFAIELADVLIRVFDLAGSLGIDLDTAVTLKMDYNETRPHRHGGKLA